MKKKSSKKNVYKKPSKIGKTLKINCKNRPPWDSLIDSGIYLAEIPV